MGSTDKTAQKEQPKFVGLPTKYKYYIGIDPGVQTGLAEWKREEKKMTVFTIPIHVAMKSVEAYIKDHPETFIRVEDARLRKWFGKSDREQLQGAGSIKRDAKIWEDYLTYLGANFEMVAPKNNKTKLSADRFKLITGYAGKTSEHARDAGMLVFGF